LVTGGARGIGRGIVERLATEGATVVSADVRPSQESPSIRPLQMDVTDAGSVNEGVTQVEREFDRLDILVNNAGVHLVKAIEDYTDADWDFVMNVNARGPFHTIRAAVGGMKRRKYGRIVNIVTILTGTPYSTLYEASKHAVMGLTKCLMYELASFNITVNAVSPGAADTELLKKGIREKAQSSGMSVDDIYSQIASTTPLGRLCQPADVAAAVAYFVSPDADYVTGEIIHATGGTFHQNLGRR
jgi:3-oxoacyl-[acyl-carrier protein] reductase